MDKAPDAYRTISEVAEDLDLPQHVLRFWETRFAQIRPLKRGGGRRYYRPEDIDLLKGIRHLLYGEGYTIRGVQRIIKESGVKAMQGLGRGEGAASLPKPRGPEIIGPAQADSDAFDDDDAADGETHEAADDRLHGGRTGPEEPELTPEGREPVFSGAGYAARPFEAVRREPVMGQPARAMEHEPGPVAPRHAGYADSSEPMPERQPAAPLRQVPEPVRRPLGPSASVVEPRMPSQAAEHAPAPAAVRRLSTDDVRRLQAAIYELTECRKRLDQAIVIR